MGRGDELRQHRFVLRHAA